MTTMTSQITSPTVVYSTVYSGADQWKHESSASLAFVWGIHRDRWIPRTNGQLRGKCFHLMMSSLCSLTEITMKSPLLKLLHKTPPKKTNPPTKNKNKQTSKLYLYAQIRRCNFSCSNNAMLSSWHMLNYTKWALLLIPSEPHMISYIHVNTLRSNRR